MAREVKEQQQLLTAVSLGGTPGYPGCAGTELAVYTP